MKRSLLRSSVTVLTALATLAAASLLFGQMKKPETKTIQGSVIDLTCATKTHAMTGTWANAKNDHVMEDGNTQKSCGAMCLSGGQPAGLFDGKSVAAVFACNPSPTLANYSGKEVEVQGFWAAGEEARIFVPLKIREGSGAWADVNCATMH